MAISLNTLVDPAVLRRVWKDDRARLRLGRTVHHYCPDQAEGRFARGRQLSPNRLWRSLPRPHLGAGLFAVEHARWPLWGHITSEHRTCLL